MRDWRDARLGALSLADYKANWDGEGAIPVPQVLIDSTITFFKHLERQRDPAPDSVYPLASGAVMAEWHYADGSTVSAEVRQVGKAEVLVWHPKRPSAFEVVTWDEAPAWCYTDTPASNRAAWEFVASWLDSHQYQAERWLDSDTHPPEQWGQDEMIGGNRLVSVG